MRDVKRPNDHSMSPREIGGDPELPGRFASLCDFDLSLAAQLIWRNQQFVYPPAVEVNDLEPPPVFDEALARFREVFQFFEYEAGHSLKVNIVIEPQAHQLGEFVNRHPARHEIGAILTAGKGRFVDRTIMKRSHDCFHDVAGGYNTFKVAVFVVYQHHVDR